MTADTPESAAAMGAVLDAVLGVLATPPLVPPTAGTVSFEVAESVAVILPVEAVWVTRDGVGATDSAPWVPVEPLLPWTAVVGCVVEAALPCVPCVGLGEAVVPCVDRELLLLLAVFALPVSLLPPAVRVVLLLLLAAAVLAEDTVTLDEGGGELDVEAEEEKFEVIEGLAEAAVSALVASLFAAACV